MRKRETCEINCDFCNKLFVRTKDYKVYAKTYCSRDCSNKHKNKRVNVKCGFCDNIFLAEKRAIARSKCGFVFCSASCSAKYNNQFRKSSNRSKIEIKFGEELQKLFPDLELVFNNRQILDGYELDIYIPELKLAIEWNGKIHYQPMYGEDKLKHIQYRDYQKQLLCQRENIDLIVITDLTSKQNQIDLALSKVSQIIEIKIKNLA